MKHYVDGGAMRATLKVIGVIVAAVLVVLFGSIVATGFLGGGNPVLDVADTAKNSAVNAAIDSSGVKSKVESTLRGNAEKIANATGLSTATVNSMIDDLDIDSWEATSLPKDATAMGTKSVSYDGMSANVTTYDDPSVVTIDSGVGSVTMSVPAGAQDYLKYLDYL